MQILGNSNTLAETRKLLLEAAGEVFAERGFRAATVREICQRAGANIAAVNYHFGDKAALYLEVLRFAQELALEQYPLNSGVSETASAEQRLRAFVHSFLRRIFDKGRIAWLGRLMSREMIEPTGALDALVKEKIRPQALQLGGIVRELLGSGATDERARLCGSSVIAQCLFYHHCRPVVSRLFPEQKFEADDIKLLAEHITQFSLAAMKTMAAPPVAKKR